MISIAILIIQTHAFKAIEAKDGEEKAQQYWEAVEENIRKECKHELAPIVAAIRYAENGGPGKEYGIIHPRVKPTYRSQAGWCAATVQKNWDRWKETDQEDDFITFLGNKYAPIGADNDPDGLNKHWIPNVKSLTEQIKRGER